MQVRSRSSAYTVCAPSARESPDFSGKTSVYNPTYIVNMYISSPRSAPLLILKAFFFTPPSYLYLWVSLSLCVCDSVCVCVLLFLRCSRTWVCRCCPEPPRATTCVYLHTDKRDLERRTPWWGHRWAGNHCMALYTYSPHTKYKTPYCTYNKQHSLFSSVWCQDSIGLTPRICQVWPWIVESTPMTQVLVYVVVVMWSNLHFAFPCRVSLGLKTLFPMSKTQAE